MRKSKAQPGVRFGALVVLSDTEPYIEPNGRRRHTVIVRCDCGAEFSKQSMYLVRGDSTSCPQCARRKYPIGARFDRLTIIGYVTKRACLYQCRCDCGVIVEKRPAQLQDNDTNSCGCVPNSKWKGVNQLSGTMLYRIKRNAAVRGINFSLSAEFLWGLYESQGRRCALSGMPIEFGRYYMNGTDTTASLDRIDSNGPYAEENVQWVHKDINLMKMDFDEQRFFELCRLVSEHNPPIAILAPTGSA